MKFEDKQDNLTFIISQSDQRVKVKSSEIANHSLDTILFCFSVSTVTSSMQFLQKDSFTHS
jgi:hypothetical protein